MFIRFPLVVGGVLHIQADDKLSCSFIQYPIGFKKIEKNVFFEGMLLDNLVPDKGIWGRL
jgi:hypothetical protein